MKEGDDQIDKDIASGGAISMAGRSVLSLAIAPSMPAIG